MGDRHGIEMGLPFCPNWEDARPAAVVNIEHPRFEGIGFTLLIIGFSLQSFAVPQAETVAHLREQLKTAKMRGKMRASS